MQGEVGEELLDHGHGLLLTVGHEAGHTLGNVGPARLVDVASLGSQHGVGQQVGVAETGDSGRDDRLEELQHGGERPALQERRLGQLEDLGQN